MSKLNLDPTQKTHFFEWLAEQRLVNYSSCFPNKGEFKQEAGYPDIIFTTEEEYIQLVIQTEKDFPEFSYDDEILKLTAIFDLDDYRKKINN